MGASVVATGIGQQDPSFPSYIYIGIPALTAAGDDLFLQVLHTGSVQQKITPPAGWTEHYSRFHDNVNGSDGWTVLFHRTADADDAGSTEEWRNLYGDTSWSLAVVRGRAAAWTFATGHFDDATSLGGAPATFALPQVTQSARHLPVYLLGVLHFALRSYVSSTVPTVRAATAGPTAYTVFVGQDNPVNGTATQRTVTFDSFAGSYGAITLAVPTNDPPSQPGAFTSPTSGQVVDASLTPAWGASTDVDGTAPVYDLYFTRDNGASFTQLADNTASTSYVHNTSAVAASTACFYRVYAIDPSGAVSPARDSPVFTVQHNIAPNAPTLTYPTGGLVLDRTVTNRFSWTTNDPNAGDTQSKYDLRYKLTSSGTWTTVSGVTPSTFRDFAASSLAAGDYEWQVRTYDSGGLVGPYSGSQFFTAATPPAGPTITSPVNGTTIVTSSGVIEFSYPTLQARQVRKVADAAGVADTATVYFDSGIVEDAAGRNHPLTYPVNNRTEHLQVRIRDGGLWSSWSSALVNVDFTPPATPSLTATPVDTTGEGGRYGTNAIEVVVTHPTPTGTEPAVASADLRRRETAVGGDGIRIAAAIGATALDETPASDLPYEYQVVAHGANGVDSFSAWTS